MDFDKITDVAFLLEDYNEKDISSILETYEQVSVVKKQLETLEDSIKDAIRVFMKENATTTYTDKKTEISVNISTVTRQDIDKEKLKVILTPNQMLSVQKITTYEKMLIMTKKMRKSLKDFLRKK